jgi:SAM-dependent methyltransferase
MKGAFQRYLRAKRTVDDRALDRRLLETLRGRLADRAEATDGPLRVLEVGAGIGTMLTRCLGWDVLPPGEIEYTAVDVDADTVAGVAPYLRTWAADRPVSLSGSASVAPTSDPDLDAATITLESAERRLEVDPVAAEAVSYVDRTAGGFDLLVGAALLDVLGLDGLEPLLGALAPGGLCYFPIVFDGATRFRPNHPMDRAVERRYHDHMDAKPGGNSRAGGAVLDRLRRRDDVRLLGVAGSDWIVRPVDGTYPADEAYFLRCILDTVGSAVDEVTDDAFADDLGGWMRQRREQLDDRVLVYMTHQLDVLGRVGAEEPA